MFKNLKIVKFYDAPLTFTIRIAATINDRVCLILSLGCLTGIQQLMILYNFLQFLRV